MERSRYADLLRVVAIGGIVYGHWLLTSVTYRNGQLSGADALDYVSWARWVTWAFQVMPVFFLVGGYVNARSWTAHHAAGETWTVWARDRAMRLWWPRRPPQCVRSALRGDASVALRIRSAWPVTI